MPGPVEGKQGKKKKDSIEDQDLHIFFVMFNTLIKCYLLTESDTTTN